MDVTRGRRRAVSTTVAAAALAVMVVVAALGLYALTLRPSVSSTSTTTSVPQTSSTTLLFPFNLTVTAPPEVLLAAGMYTQVVTLGITPSPSAYSLTSFEIIPLNATTVDGITPTFSPSTAVDLYGNTPVNVTVILTASTSALPGNYTFHVQAGRGSGAQTGSFNVRVVKYLVFEIEGEFQPGDLNVTVGSTVYWMDLDSMTAVYCAAPPFGPHDVVFTALTGANSPEMHTDSVYAYTFTKAGSYFYYSMLDTDHLMNGTITVTG